MVIVPESDTIFESTVKLLQQFLEAGGSVICMRRRPTRIEGKPAAELDDAHLVQLMGALEKPGLQLFLTALRQDALPITNEPGMFHVKHGNLLTLI